MQYIYSLLTAETSFITCLDFSTALRQHKRILRGLAVNGTKICFVPAFLTCFRVFKLWRKMLLFSNVFNEGAFVIESQTVCC